MLKTIPKRILTHTATLQEPTTDSYGVTTYTETTLDAVHVQHNHTVVRSSNNTEVNLAAVMFFDARISRPHGTDLLAKQITADEAGAQMKLTYSGQVFTVYAVEVIPDDEGKLHHYEVLLQ